MRQSFDRAETRGHPPSPRGVLLKSISVTAERGSVSRSTFNRSKTHGISCARSALRAAAGRRPALRSIWATRPKAMVDRGYAGRAFNSAIARAGIPRRQTQIEDPPSPGYGGQARTRTRTTRKGNFQPSTLNCTPNAFGAQPPNYLPSQCGRKVVRAGK